MLDPGPARAAQEPIGRTSVLRAASVDRELTMPPGRQLERQLAVMVREGRLEPGRRLPSTRRLAPAVGLHRNTVAAVYRRLAARGLVELRHGARARVWPVAAGGRCGGAGRVLAAAADDGTARLMASEIRAAAPSGVDVEPIAVDRAGRCVPGGVAPGERLVAALPGPALRRIAREQEGEPPGGVVRALQDRRARIRQALLGAPPLAVVVAATGCPLLREAVRSDASRLRGREITVRTGSVRRERRPNPRDGDPAPPPDLVIADRLAAGAFCGERRSPSGPDVVRARLLSRESLAAVAAGVGGAGGGAAVVEIREEREEGRP